MPQQITVSDLTYAKLQKLAAAKKARDERNKDFDDAIASLLEGFNYLRQHAAQTATIVGEYEAAKADATEWLASDVATLTG